MATHVGLVLDMSGSMYTAYESTVESLKKYLKGQKKEDPEAIFSLVAFNHDIEKWVNSTPINLIKTSEIVKKYRPNGTTALYDAIGKTIEEIKKNLKKNDKALVVILTDGYENASKEYSLNTIREMIDKLQKKNWTFIFLGANIDSRRVATSISIPIGNTSDYVYGLGQFRIAEALPQVYRSVSGSASASTTTAFADAQINTSEFTQTTDEKLWTPEDKKEKEDATSK